MKKKLSLKKTTLKQLATANLQIKAGAGSFLPSNGLFNCATIKPCWQQP